jgi:hypothetical protein
MLSWAGRGRSALFCVLMSLIRLVREAHGALIPPREELESEKKEENNVEEETEWSITQWKVRVHTAC